MARAPKPPKGNLTRADRYGLSRAEYRLRLVERRFAARDTKAQKATDEKAVRKSEVEERRFTRFKTYSEKRHAEERTQKRRLHLFAKYPSRNAVPEIAALAKSSPYSEVRFLAAKLLVEWTERIDRLRHKGYRYNRDI